MTTNMVMDNTQKREYTSQGVWDSDVCNVLLLGYQFLLIFLVLNEGCISTACPS